MPYSTSPKTGSGTTLSYEDQALPGTYIELVEVTGSGPLGETTDFVDATPLRNATPRQIDGDVQVTSGEWVFFDVPGDTDMAAFLALAQSRSTIKMRQIRSTGRQIDFTATLGGRLFMEQSRGEPDKVKVPYTITTAITEQAAP